VDRASAAGRLWLGQVELGTLPDAFRNRHAGEAVAHGQRPAVEVNIGPPQAERFALAQAGGRGDGEEGL